MRAIKEWGNEKKIISKIIGKLTLTYSLFGIMFYIVLTFAIELLPKQIIVTKDLIPLLKTNHIIAIELIIVIIILGTVKNKKYRRWVKKCEGYLKGILIVQFIALVFKGESILSLGLTAIYIEIILIISRFLSVEDIFFRKKYEERNYSEYDIYSDEPISDKNLLSTHLQKEVERIERVIDNLNTCAPFTFSVEGEWGAGKTSVLYSLERELLQRKTRDKKRYFVLKIDTLLFNSSEEIIQYVKKYFQALFFRYDVELFPQGGMDDYLSVVLETLSKGSAVLSPILTKSEKKKGIFRDVHISREEFQEKIHRLLINSERDKIILLVDDTDRNGNDEQVILSIIKEVFTVQGIINIIVRKEDSEYRVELDKFIHMKLKINKDENIELDNQINSLIRVGEARYINNLKDKELLTIPCYYAPAVSYYDTMKYTTGVIKRNGQRWGSVEQRKIFFDTFILDISYNSKNIGRKLEDIIMKYISEQQEVKKIKQNLSDENKSILKQMLKAQHDIFFEDSVVRGDIKFNWINKLSQFTGDAVMFLSIIIKVITTNQYHDCKNVEDVHNKYWGHQSMILPDGEKLPNGQLQYVWHIMFSESERQCIDTYIEEHNTEELKKILLSKRQVVIIKKAEVILLTEFLKYIRRIANNPRTLKYLIRESNLYEINLLEYIIEKVELNGEVEEDLKRYEIDKSGVEIRLLSEFLEKAFYYYYVYNQVSNTEKEEGDKFIVLMPIKDKFNLVYYRISKLQEDKELEVDIKFIPIQSDEINKNLEEVAQLLLEPIREFEGVREAQNIMFRELESNESYRIENLHLTR